ncbi:ribonuclease H-like domain-containing protein [Tanacetum coccineum]
MGRRLLRRESAYPLVDTKAPFWGAGETKKALGGWEGDGEEVSVERGGWLRGVVRSDRSVKGAFLEFAGKTRQQYFRRHGGGSTGGWVAVARPCVELINNHDAGNPLYLQNNDNSSLAIVNVKLVGAENYKMWVMAMKIALKGKNKMEFIDGQYAGQVYFEIALEVWNELKEIYDKMDGSTILAKDPLPNAKDVFNVVSREESHRGLHPGSSSSSKVQPATFIAKTNNNTNNFNRRVNVKHSVPRTSGSISSSFTNEHMVKLLSLINEKPTPTANMLDFFMLKLNLICIMLLWTDSTKNMFNVVDVSSLMLTVGHPNGTIAKIYAIGSLRLTSGIVLFDVLVAPEYNDLNLGKLVGIGSVTGCLYLFDLDKIGKSASSNSVFVCHVPSKLWHCRLGHPADQAKQTREPFPLSDHKSKSVGDIVHCDVWGPYRVVSDDGFKYFLTIVDDYSRAVWVYLLKSKTEVGKSIESFIKLVFTQFGKKVKVVSPYDEEGDTSTEDGNSRVASDDCTAVEDEVARGATHIEENVTFEGNVHVIKMASQNPKWFEVMNLEMEALFRNNTYVLVDFPPETKAIGYVYMELPLVYYDKNETRVFKLVKSLYGLKQAPRQWNEKLTAALIEHGFVQSKNDYSLYIKDENGIFIAILVYVNDIVVTCNNNSEFEKFKHFVSTKFMIKDLGQLKYFLGIEVLEIESGLCLSQRKYCLELLNKYGLLACKPAATPLQ